MKKQSRTDQVVLLAVIGGATNPAQIRGVTRDEALASAARLQRLGMVTVTHSKSRLTGCDVITLEPTQKAIDGQHSGGALMDADRLEVVAERIAAALEGGDKTENAIHVKHRSISKPEIRHALKAMEANGVVRCSVSEHPTNGTAVEYWALV